MAQAGTAPRDMLITKTNMESCTEAYGDTDVGDLAGLSDITRSIGNNYTRLAENTRNKFAEFFISSQGELPWQYDYVNRTT